MKPRSARRSSWQRLLSSSVFLLLGLACGTSRSQMPPQRSVVDGDWQTDCTRTAFDFPRRKTFLSLRNARDIERTDLYYRDEACTEPALAEQLSGSYALSVSRSDVEYKMDMKFEAFDAIALSSKAEQMLKAQRYCGLSQWGIGNPQNIALLSGAGCRSLGVLPIVNWNRVAVRSQLRLEFAAEIEHDNIRPEKVESVDPNLQFMREPEVSTNPLSVP